MQKKVKRGYYASLYEVAAVLNSTRNPESVLSSIVKKVAHALEAKGCSILLLSPDKKRLLHTVAYGLSDDYVRKGYILVDRSIAETLECGPVAISDAAGDERVQYPEWKKTEGIVSILSVPMVLRDDAIGVIRVYTAEERHFTRDDIYFVSAVANLGALALENARLYDSIHKDYHTVMEELLEWRAAFGDEWIGEGSDVVATRWWEYI